MKHRYDIQSLKTKQHIFDVANQLFWENGYQNTSLGDIAKAAEVSIGTLYKYYPFKGNLLLQIGISSVTRLSKFAADLPETITVKEKILSVMMNDIEGAIHHLHLSNNERDDVVPTRKYEIQMAFRREIYKNKDRLDTEINTRQRLADIYRAILDDEKDNGTLTRDADTQAISEIIVAVFFAEFDSGMYIDHYPYENQFSRKLNVLLEHYVL